MKIHATRIEAPTPGEPHATTRWAAAVTFGDGRVETFLGGLEISGYCKVVVLPDSAPVPHVYVEPGGHTTVLAALVPGGQQRKIED